MKIALVTLSGSPERAIRALAQLYPDATVEMMPRAAVEAGSMASRIGHLRQVQPDVFAVMTENLSFQYGQDALMLFGAIGGAGESIVLDSHGGLRSAKRLESILKGPARIARCLARGRSAVRRATKELGRLEGEITRFVPKARPANGPVTINYIRAINAAGTLPGGATTHINGVVKGLLRLGSRMTLISNDEISGLSTDLLPIKIIKPDAGIMPRSGFDIHNGIEFSRAASAIAAASPADIIYQRYSRYSWAGVEASIATGAPLFLEYNGSEVWIGKSWDKMKSMSLLERCEDLNLSAATLIFVVSDVERRNLLDRGVSGEQIVVNPNGVDTELFRPGIGGTIERKRLGIPPGTIVVGFVGTFGPWHGVLALARAIALVPRDANIHFLFVGDGVLRPDVERELGDSDDLGRVTFNGAVPHDSVPVMLDACDILVSPHVPLWDGSEFFGSPTKLFEYMAMGKGIIASRLGQIGDVLVDDETALLVEPGDVRELSIKIQQLASDPVLLERLGMAARARAIEHHTWEMNARTIIDEYRNLDRSGDQTNHE